MTNYIGFYGSIESKEAVVEDCNPEARISGHPWWAVGYLLCTECDSHILTLVRPKKQWVVRVKEGGFEPLGKPTYLIGSRVFCKSRDKYATVKDVMFHYNRSCFYYTLDYGDRVSTNWFFDDDLEPAENHEHKGGHDE